MQTKTPDEQGWYWAKSVDDLWYMAFVDTGRERVFLYNNDYPHPDVEELSWPDFPDGLIAAWYGPFQCPGGDFGGLTVVSDEELHKHAEAEKKVIGIVHFDYRYCREERHGSAFTISGVYTQEEADARIQREVKDATE